MSKNKMSKYPIGATWEAVDDRGKIGRIFLEERNEYFEVWRWYVVYKDGSSYRHDWTMSYKMCRDMIPIWKKNGKPIRFKRIK